jgi:hypothetical protein
MATHTEQEPMPRPNAVSIARRIPDWPIVSNWPRQVRAPASDFLATLNARRSRTGGNVPDDDLASLLRHSTLLRERRLDGRFGTWESRSAPAAGGIHAFHLLCLPLGRNEACGVYDADAHALRAPHSLEDARALNMRSVATIAEAEGGTTLQLVVDRDRYEACYDHCDSLIWRDAGALIAVISLVGTLLGLDSVPLGRHGDDIVLAARLSAGFAGAGGIHISSKAVPETMARPGS